MRLKYSSRVSIVIVIIWAGICLSSCVKDFDIVIKPNAPQLVVEAYINNLMPTYNYVVLSRSLDYLSPTFQSTPVDSARVFITEGEFRNNQYNWNAATKTQLVEAGIPGIPAGFKSGLYADPRLATNPQRALLGTPGKSYLLEITEGENQYSAITTLLMPIKIDSLTLGFRYVDEDDSSKNKARITNHFKDPDTLNNTQFYYFRYNENRTGIGWGALSKSRIAGTDDLTNGQYMHLTHPRGFVVGDTVNYYMASVTRDVYTFWDSFNKARDNNGPFATPITLKSNLQGKNVTGCFTGLSLSGRTLVVD